MAKDNFLFHFDDLEILEDMSDEEVGAVFRAVIMHAKEGIEPEMSDRFLKHCYRILTKRHDADVRAYEERCKQNSINGSKGGRPKKQTVFEETEKSERFFEKPKKADIDIDIDTDIDIDIDTDIDTEYVSDMDIKKAPAGASPLLQTLSQQIKEKVVKDGNVSTVADGAWISPTKIKQLDDNIYILSGQKQMAEFIRDRYGSLFADAIREVMPDFKGSVIYATG